MPFSSKQDVTRQSVYHRQMSSALTFVVACGVAGLGGLGSIKGTMVSALILGQVISVGGTLWSPLSFVAPFVVMFIVILVKPTGLYGVRGKAFGFE